MPVVVAILAALAAGFLIGLISGVLHAYLEVPAFIATLVIGQITQGAAYLFNDGRSFGGFPESYVFLGNGSLLGVPISDYIMVVFVLAGVFVTTKTAIGTQIYGLGGNEQVLKNAGIDTAKIKLFVFSMSGFCAAAAGVLLAAQLDTAHPTQGEPYQLDAIAACIIGGVSMSGGEGKVILSMVGALVIGSIRNILNLLSVNSFYQNILVGVIIIAVVAVSMMTPRAPREQNRAVRSRRSRRAEGIERRRTMQQQQTAGKPGRRPPKRLDALCEGSRQHPHVPDPLRARLRVCEKLLRRAQHLYGDQAGRRAAGGLHGPDVDPHHRWHRPFPGLHAGSLFGAPGHDDQALRLPPAWQAIPLTLLIGAAVGLFNGSLVQFLRVPAFIATLGSGYVLYGIAQIFGKGDAFYQLPEDLLAFGDTRAAGGHPRIAARRRAGQYIHLPTGKTADVCVHFRHRRGAGLLFAP